MIVLLLSACACGSGHGPFAYHFSKCEALSFISLVCLFPWVCFAYWELPWCFWSVFCLFSKDFKGSQGEKILGVLEVVLGKKKKKDRVSRDFAHLS